MGKRKQGDLHHCFNGTLREFAPVLGCSDRTLGMAAAPKPLFVAKEARDLRVLPRLPWSKLEKINDVGTLDETAANAVGTVYLRRYRSHAKRLWCHSAESHRSQPVTSGSIQSIAELARTCAMVLPWQADRSSILGTATMSQTPSQKRIGKNTGLELAAKPHSSPSGCSNFQWTYLAQSHA